MEGLANKDGGVDGCRERSNQKDELQHNKALILPHTSLLFFEAKACKIQYASAEPLRKPPTARRNAKSEFMPSPEYSRERRGRSAAHVVCTRQDRRTAAPSACRRSVLIHSAGASRSFGTGTVKQRRRSKSLLVAEFPTWLIGFMWHIEATC